MASCHFNVFLNGYPVMIPRQSLDQGGCSPCCSYFIWIGKIMEWDQDKILKVMEVKKLFIHLIVYF